MKKVKLDIFALEYSQTQSGAYVLVLREESGRRKLPIIIGGAEAQAIALELEKMTPSRPLTHDLFKNFAVSFGIEIQEVIIYNIMDGIFFAKLICHDGTRELEIDARTSDAIALATRFLAPIYTYEFILASVGVLSDETKEEDNPEKSVVKKKSVKDKVSKEKDLPSYTFDELNDLLRTELDNENYERASIIRDEINRRKKSQ